MISNVASNVTAKASQAAATLSSKIKKPFAAKMNNYVNERIIENSLKLGDSFTSKKSKALAKVAKKATEDWMSAHKIQGFIVKNSSKIAKGGMIAAGVAATAAVIGLAAKAINAVKGDK